jgi:hypothetical protein
MGSIIVPAASPSAAVKSMIRMRGESQEYHRAMVERSKEAINGSWKLLRWISNNDLTGGIFPIDVDYFS